MIPADQRDRLMVDDLSAGVARPHGQVCRTGHRYLRHHIGVSRSASCACRDIGNLKRRSEALMHPIWPFEQAIDRVESVASCHAPSAPLPTVAGADPSRSATRARERP